MKKLLIALLAGLFVAACAPSTPQARIEQEPAKFAALSSRERDLVRHGQLAHGMSEDAVWLAWGPPDQRFDGSKRSKPASRWDYVGSRPVYSTFYGGGVGYGYGGYGRGRYGYSTVGVGIGPEVTYVPQRLATVWFENHRVEGWERAR